ncbi:MAG: Fe-S-containing protein [Chloroflexi bacterium]|nr:Fe-S-containing protein [Chloroflexota bacterium]
MVESLVITLREGIEAALVVGIILAYLQKTGRSNLNRFVFGGLALAIIASLGLAAVFRAIDFDPENEILEGTMLGVAGIFVATMVIWMWRTARNIKGAMENRLQSIVGADADPGQALAPGLALAGFTFFMVLREGIETVLFLAAATVGEFDLLAALGAAIGIGLAVLFALLLTRGSLRINLPRFFTVTGVVLLVLAVKLIIGSVHEFAEVELIPMNGQVMAVLGYFVRDASSTVILMALLALPMLLVLWDTGKKEGVAQASRDLNPAERRKLRAHTQRDLAWRGSLTFATLIVLLAMATSVFASAKSIDPTPTPVTPTGGEIRIPISDLPDGEMAKVSYQSPKGITVKFIVVAEAGEAPKTALDACQVCGPIGYMQQEHNLICKNCNAPIPISTIGNGGGCNPIPLKSHVDGSYLVVSAGDLDAAQNIFNK